VNGIAAYVALEENHPRQHPWEIRVVTHMPGQDEPLIQKLDAGRVVATPSSGVDAAAADAVLIAGGWVRASEWAYTGGGLFCCTVVPADRTQG
jgi:hypothetical protein